MDIQQRQKSQRVPAKPNRSFRKQNSKCNSKFLVGGRGPRYVVVQSRNSPQGADDRPLPPPNRDKETCSALEELWQVEAEMRSVLKKRAQHDRAANPKSAAEYARDLSTDQRVLGGMRAHLSKLPDVPAAPAAGSRYRRKLRLQLSTNG
jgi:hypothetical protein